MLKEIEDTQTILNKVEHQPNARVYLEGACHVRAVSNYLSVMDVSHQTFITKMEQALPELSFSSGISDVDITDTAIEVLGLEATMYTVLFRYSSIQTVKDLMNHTSTEVMTIQQISENRVIMILRALLPWCRKYNLDITNYPLGQTIPNGFTE